MASNLPKARLIQAAFMLAFGENKKEGYFCSREWQASESTLFIEVKDNDRDVGRIQQLLETYGFNVSISNFFRTLVDAYGSRWRRYQIPDNLLDWTEVSD